MFLIILSSTFCCLCNSITTDRMYHFNSYKYKRSFTLFIFLFLWNWTFHILQSYKIHCTGLNWLQKPLSCYEMTWQKYSKCIIFQTRSISSVHFNIYNNKFKIVYVWFVFPIYGSKNCAQTSDFCPWEHLTILEGKNYMLNT